MEILLIILLKNCHYKKKNLDSIESAGLLKRFFEHIGYVPQKERLEIFKNIEETNKKSSHKEYYYSDEKRIRIDPNKCMGKLCKLCVAGHVKLICNVNIATGEQLQINL